MMSYINPCMCPFLLGCNVIYIYIYILYRCGCFGMWEGLWAYHLFSMKTQKCASSIFCSISPDVIYNIKKILFINSSIFVFFPSIFHLQWIKHR